MGGRGFFLESGSFSAPARWHTVDYFDGIKVLAPKDSKASISQPECSNTSGTAYVAYGKDGVFKQFVVFNDSKMPVYEIDYGVHNHEKSLHVHYYQNGERSKTRLRSFPEMHYMKSTKNYLRGVK